MKRVPVAILGAIALAIAACAHAQTVTAPAIPPLPSTAATTPLAGPELVPGVQSGAPVELTANAIAARALSETFTNSQIGGETLASDVLAFTTTGNVASGDGGGALWAQGTGCPAAGKIASANGQCYVIASPVLDVRMFGAVANFGTVDATAALNAAITYAEANARPLHVPNQTFEVIPATNFINEGGSTFKGAFPFASNLDIEADPGATFKIANGVSTDATPVPMAMFWTNGVETNITIRGLTCDMNGANNLISPNRASLVYNTYNQACIDVTGTGGLPTASASNVDLEYDAFENTPGVSFIVMAQSNEAGAVLGSGWTVSNDSFLNGGLDTNDHSSVYAWANDVTAENNTFTEPTPFGTVGEVGGNVAFEVHGAKQKFVDNTVDAYQQGMWLDGNYTSPADGILVAGNTFRTVFFGVATFENISTITALSNVIIKDNAFYFDDTAISAIPALNLKQAFTISSGHAVSGITVRGNRMFKTGTVVAATFANIGASTDASQIVTGIVVSGNEGDGLSIGADTSTNGTNGLGDITITDNNWTNLTPAGIYTYPIGDNVSVAAGGPIASLTLGGGSVVDTRASPLTEVGMYLAGPGTITNLNMLPAAFVGVQTAKIEEAGGLVVTNRNGPPEAGVLGSGTSASGTVTINALQGVIHTESLTTAAGAEFTETLTDPQIKTTSQVYVSLGADTNTGGIPTVGTVTPGSGSAVIEILNAGAAAFNGSLVEHFRVVNN